jgi:energy-coupling factor transporter ATP-binding protein EcfA2
MELKEFRIEKLETSAFKSLEKINVDLDKVTYIVARNGAGKSSILNALTWAATGYDVFGNRIDPFMIGGPFTTWVKIETIIDGKPVTLRRIIQLKNKGKTETQTNVSLEFDKELFYSLVNPRYVQSLDPKGIKNVIAKAIRMPVSILEMGIEDELCKIATPYTGFDSYEKIVAVEDGIKAISSEIKKLEEEIIGCTGKINAIEMLFQLYSDNGKEIDEEALELHRLVSDDARSIIELRRKEVEQKKEISKQLSAYRTAAYEVLAEELNTNLKKVKIKLLENGKETFILTYDGKNVRACSNSEQLLAGLEIIDALSDATDMRYPCLVDNAEAIINIDTDNYPHINQFVFAVVADENLSTWDEGTEVLTEISTGKLMPRSREQLVPTVKLLSGWGSK